MKTSSEINELAAALMLVQAQVGNLPKTASGYGYRYTPLDDVTAALTEPLSANGLAYVQMPTTPPVEYGLSVALTTRLMHVSGQWLEDTMLIPVPSVGKANEAQNYGAALTYARRYALTAMFGIAADDDTDAATPAQTPKQAPATNGQKPTPPPAPQPVPAPASKTGRPLDPAGVLAAMKKKTEGKGDRAPSDKQRKYAMSSLASVTAGDEQRHAIMRYLFGKESGNDLTGAECSALIDWIGYKQVGDDWLPDPDAITEAARIVEAAAVNEELF